VNEPEPYVEILRRLDLLVAEAQRTPPVIDPTKNVLDLVAAAIERQDDLRQAEAKRLDNLREAEGRRLDNLRRLERYFNERFDAQAERLRSAEAHRIDAQALAESRRIDALLQAAQQGVTLANEKQQAAAATLAAAVTSSAEALRATVTATAAQTNSSIQTLRDTMDKRMAEIERRQYEGHGRDIQRGEGRQGTQWATSSILTVVVLLVATATAIVVALTR
jgi:hypothetical protein